MQIAFSKVGNLPYPFNLPFENLAFSGTLTRKSPKLVHCSGELKGCCETPCASCAEPVGVELCEQIELDLSDGIFKDNENELSDTMEFFDGEIDLLSVASSELELYLSDYFYCENCKEKAE